MLLLICCYKSGALSEHYEDRCPFFFGLGLNSTRSFCLDPVTVYESFQSKAENSTRNVCLSTGCFLQSLEQQIVFRRSCQTQSTRTCRTQNEVGVSEQRHTSCKHSFKVFSHERFPQQLANHSPYMDGYQLGQSATAFLSCPFPARQAELVDEHCWEACLPFNQACSPHQHSTY